MAIQTSRPVLFSNGTKEDNEAYQLLSHSGIDFELRGPTLEDQTPLVLFRCQRFHGLDEIKDFVLHVPEKT